MSQRRPDHVSAAPQATTRVDDAHMWTAPAFRKRLNAAGLSSVAQFMATDAGRLLRALPDRENWRLELPDAKHGPRAAYLKKHHTRSWRNRLRVRFGLSPATSPGRVEADNVARLKLDGIDAMRLIAYGDRSHPDGLLESFVMTEELAGFTQLDHYLRGRFARRDERARRDRRLQQLIKAVAAVAARFHRSGYNHRDLYCCHFFIRESSPGDYQVNLIDLQRVEHRRWFRRRWIVKDLAQLAYSAPVDRVSCTQKMAFVKHYLGVRKLRPGDKQLIRQVLAKQQLMQRDLGAHP